MSAVAWLKRPRVVMLLVAQEAMHAVGEVMLKPPKELTVREKVA